MEAEDLDTKSEKMDTKEDDNSATTEDKVSDEKTERNGSMERKPGVAWLKPEFILHDYKPQIQTEYLSPAMQQQMEENDKNNAEETTNTEEGVEGDNSSKKKKLRGRNKQRPRKEKVNAKDRFCPALKEGRICSFGDKCIFSHDKKQFMADKRPDLPGPCYNFEQFGYCKYSLACRFAKGHLTDDFENITNKELYEKHKDHEGKNFLKQDVKKMLWKKKYDFKKANGMIQKVQTEFRGGSVCKPSVSDSHCKSDDNSHSVLTNSSSVPGDVNSNSILVDSSSTTESVNLDTSLDAKTAEFGSTADSSANTCDTDTTKYVYVGDNETGQRSLGQITDEEMFPLRGSEKVKIDFKNKLYLAPLTTVGNLPFRRICKEFGVEVTCGEMALATQLLQAKQSEWSLLRRHESEDIFGAQICGGYPDTMTRCAQLLTETCDLDFIDINCGCPIELIFKKGSGSALMGKATKLEQICRSMLGVMGDTPLTVKVRTGVFDDRNIAHSLIPRLRDAGVSLVTVHGRSREQRYTRKADWDYVQQCARVGAPMPVFGNGDILSFEDANLHMETHGVSGIMIARGALIKPWVFTEIKEQRHWDISSTERYDMLKNFTNYGLEHWGSDSQGVETTRRFLLEWLSFLYRYIPVGVLEQPPQKINERPPYYIGRNDLETLMASRNCADWVKISEMLLGPVPPSFRFLPKHKANAYQ